MAVGPWLTSTPSHYWIQNTLKLRTFWRMDNPSLHYFGAFWGLKTTIKWYKREAPFVNLTLSHYWKIGKLGIDSLGKTNYNQISHQVEAKYVNYDWGLATFGVCFCIISARCLFWKNPSWRETVTETYSLLTKISKGRQLMLLTYSLMYSNCNSHKNLTVFVFDF